MDRLCCGKQIFTSLQHHLYCSYAEARVWVCACLKLTQCHIFLDGELYLYYCTVTVGELDYRIAAPLVGCR